MQPNHQAPLYRASRTRDFGAEMARLNALHRSRKTPSSLAPHNVGRNRLTRTIDAALEFVRRYLPPLHWIGVRFSALLLYGYARAVGATAELVTLGSYRWPEVAKGSVLAIWHGSLPSLLGAFAARRPGVPVKLMVSSDARGDCVAVFCRWLGLEIVRGDAEHGGWKALQEIANEVTNGAVALISPDGSGPAFVAKVGAITLASALCVPLIPVGANCRPSVFERHKWDDARNPLPYGRIAVACGDPLTFPPFEDAASLELACRQLEDVLNRADADARAALAALKKE